MKMHPSRPVRAASGQRLLAAFGMLVLAGATHAQYALDGNLQYGSRGINPATQSVRDVYMFRNSVLTGNVPGRSFRANLGYTAPNDFRGELGSDDLYRFARDSYFSGLALQGISSVSTAHSTLAATDPNGFARFPVSRSAQGVSLNEVRSRMQDRLLVPVGAPPAFSTLSGAEFARSLSLRESDATLRGTVLGYNSMQEGSLVEVGASSLRGLYEIPLIDQSVEDAARDLTPPAPQMPSALGAEPTPAGSLDRMVNEPQPGQRLSNRVQTRLPGVGDDPYTDLLDRFASDYERRVEEAEATPDVEQEASEARLDRLLTFEEQYRQLTELLQKRAEPGTDREADEADGVPQFEGLPTTELTQADVKPKEIPETDVEALLRRYLPREIREDMSLDNLAGRGETLFAKQMRRAQELLGEGKYFDAEAQFSAALTARPSHPLAQLGKLNSQVGAGLFLSAGATLRKLAVTHPEVLVVQYGENVLPDEERLEGVLVMLEERAERQKSFAPTAALLMSYLGHALDDRELVERGLDRLEALGDPDALAPVLRALWLEPASTESG